MLSDMGYTHTKMYQFNLTTPAHNMVCVDFANHYFRDRQKGKGSIEYMDTANPRVQIIAVNAPNTQPGLTHNRRTLFLIRNGKGETYAADFMNSAKAAAITIISFTETPTMKNSSTLTIRREIPCFQSLIRLLKQST